MKYKLILIALFTQRARINLQIRAAELRVIGPEGENFGVMPFRDAMTKAHDLGLDLIEISPTAVPPIAKIMDFGKYQYEEAKKQKTAKSKLKTVEVKTLQVKIGTGEHDLELEGEKCLKVAKRRKPRENRPFSPRPGKIYGFQFPERAPRKNP